MLALLPDFTHLPASPLAAQARSGPRGAV